MASLFTASRLVLALLCATFAAPYVHGGLMRVDLFGGIKKLAGSGRGYPYYPDAVVRVPTRQIQMKELFVDPEASADVEDVRLVDNKHQSASLFNQDQKQQPLIQTTNNNKSLERMLRDPRNSMKQFGGSDLDRSATSASNCYFSPVACYFFESRRRR